MKRPLALGHRRPIPRPVTLCCSCDLGSDRVEFNGRGHNDAGIAQARLALSVVRAFIAKEVGTRGERVGLKLLERLAEMAIDIAAVRVFLLYGVDPLEAVPLEQFRTTTALHKVRWPQILAEVTRKRESIRKLAAEAPRRGK